MVDIAPSILSADLTALGDALERIRVADRVHLDVMDGHFVPNISFGPPVIASVRERTQLPLDVHLMVERPADYVADLAALDVQTITVHAEVCPHLFRTVDEIQAHGVDAGVAINPATSLEAVEAILGRVDRVLVMSVDPGFAGQSFLPEVLPKVRTLDATSDVEIEVDGGITPVNAPDCIDAGGDVLVSGSAIFESDSVAETVRALRQPREIESR
jgi:ribulose-phosphate 3-epimerase